MELAAEEQVDNEVEAEYQQVMLEEGRTLPPVSHSLLELFIGPDTNIVISDDEHPLPNDIFAISPSMGHRSPKSIADDAVSSLDNVVAEHPLEKPDPPPDSPGK